MMRDMILMTASIWGNDSIVKSVNFRDSVVKNLPEHQPVNHQPAIFDSQGSVNRRHPVLIVKIRFIAPLDGYRLTGAIQQEVLGERHPLGLRPQLR